MKHLNTLTLIAALTLASCTISHTSKRTLYEVYMCNGNREMSILTCDSVQMQSKAEATAWIKGKPVKLFAESILISN